MTHPTAVLSIDLGGDLQQQIMIPLFCSRTLQEALHECVTALSASAHQVDHIVAHAQTGGCTLCRAQPSEPDHA